MEWEGTRRGMLPAESLHKQSLINSAVPTKATSRKAILDSVESANQTIHEKAQETEPPSGMGTTLVAAAIEGELMAVANVGDSRALLVREGKVRQLTTDHSWVQEEIDAGRLTESEAENHPRRNLITRALGLNRQVPVDVLSEKLQVGDTLVLCTDGLWGQVQSDRIQEVLSESPLEEAVSRLVGEANESGGPDNITVLCVKVIPQKPEMEDLEVTADLPEPSPAGGPRLENSEPSEALHERWLVPGVLAFFLLLAGCLYWILT